MQHGLARLVEPLSVEQFLSDYYEQRPLYGAGRSPSRFLDLFSREIAEALLWQQEERLLSFLGVYKHGKGVMPQRGVGSLDLLKWALDQYHGGASLAIGNAENFHLPLAIFLRELEELVGSRVAASAILTPPGSRAYDAHFDVEEVFVIQCEGTKQFQLFSDAKPAEFPLKRASFDPDRYTNLEDLGTPSMEVLLKAGDVLYIPRGLFHVAQTLDEPSVHLSVLVNPPLVVEVARSALELAAEANVELRWSLPFDRSKWAESRSLEDMLAKLGDALGARLSLDAVVQRQRQRFIAGLRALPDHRFSSGDDARHLHLGNYVRRAAGVISWVATTDRGAELCYPGIEVVRRANGMPSTIKCPPQIEPALQFIANQERPFQICAIPGGLSDRSKLVLSRRLIVEGMLQVVERIPSDSRLLGSGTA